MEFESSLKRCGPIEACKATLAAASGDAVIMDVPKIRPLVNLRGVAGDPGFCTSVGSALGVELPTEPNRWNAGAAADALWLGPDEWLLVATDGGDDAARLERSIRLARPDDPWLSVVDVSHNYACLLLAGSSVRELLAKGCPLDLHPRAFSAGCCVQSMLASTRVLLRCLDDRPSIELWLRNSFAAYATDWVLDAALEFNPD